MRILAARTSLSWSGERFHRAALRGHLKRLACCVVPQRQRDEAVVADLVEFELQLRTPKPAVSHDRALGWVLAVLAAIQRLVQLSQPAQAGGQHRLVRAVAVVAPIQQRHLPGLAHQDSQPHHAQILALALGVTALGQLAWRRRCNVRIKVRGVEREHVGRKLKARHGRLGDRHLGLLKLDVADLLGHAMKRLASERRSRQARDARQARVEKLGQVTLGARRAGPLDRHRHCQFADRGAVLGTHAPASSVDVPHQVKLRGHPGQGADVAQPARAHGVRGAQVGQRRRCRRSKHDLARDAASLLGIPHRLRRDAIAATSDFPFEYVHVPSCIS